MLNIFTLANGRLFQEEIESLEELSRFQPIWVDLESPTLEEKRWVKQYYGLSIPEDAMDEDIEESARFYEEDNGELHIRSDFLIADDHEPRTVRVAFILNQHQHRTQEQRRAVFHPRRRRARVPAAAPARAARTRADRRRQGSPAQAV
jgi:magnesium transporter